MNVRSLVPATTVRPMGRHGLDWMVAGLSVWLVGAVHLDAWAHHRVALETFFTPWHGVLYAEFLAPAGYEASVAGVLVFLAGGLADMVWHTVLGIEVNVVQVTAPVE